MKSKPVVMVPACNRMLGQHPFHVVGQKYVDAVRLAGCLPLVAPPLADDDFDSMLALADGVLLTGAVSNVHPSHFDEALRNPALPLDPVRDATTLRLIPQVLERGIPLFAICRGFQEANVALGGSLHQAVQEVAGYQDHRGAPGVADAPAEQVYSPSHAVHVAPGGVLGTIVDGDSFIVNSVHGQGINRLAAGLRIEATAPDGLVEAFSVPGAAGFNLSVQWHPEWQAAGNPVSVQLFQAFGRACQNYRDRHRPGPPSP